MRLLLNNTIGTGNSINTILGRIEDGEPNVVVSMPTVKFLEVQSTLNATANLTYQIVEGTATAAWTSTSVVLNSAQTFTVAGVDVTSIAIANFGGNLPAGLIAGVQCTAANTIIVTVINITGVPATVPNTTVNIFWTSPAAQ